MSVVTRRPQKENLLPLLTDSYVTKLILVFLMGVGILQYSVPEASDAGHHSWSKGEI